MSDEGIQSTKDGSNRYELIIAAAREARRLNDYYRNRGLEPKSRITTEAMHRASHDGISFTYQRPREEPEADAEAPA